MRSARVMGFKAFLLGAAILGFVPVILSRDEMAAWIYLGSLIVVHVVAVGILLARVRWRHVVEDRRRLWGRLSGLAALAALAGLLRFDAEGSAFWWSIVALWVLHVLALPLLHFVRKGDAAGPPRA